MRWMQCSNVLDGIESCIPRVFFGKWMTKFDVRHFPSLSILACMRFEMYVARCTTASLSVGYIYTRTTQTATTTTTHNTSWCAAWWSIHPSLFTWSVIIRDGLSLFQAQAIPEDSRTSSGWERNGERSLHGRQMDTSLHRRRRFLTDVYFYGTA